MNFVNDFLIKNKNTLYFILPKNLSQSDERGERRVYYRIIHDKTQALNARFIWKVKFHGFDLFETKQNS